MDAPFILSNQLAAFALCLQSELAARGIDFVAFFLSDGEWNFTFFQDASESLLAFDVRTFPWKSFDLVVGDQIDMGMEAARDLRELVGLVKGVVHILNQDVFKGEHPSVVFAKVLGSWNQFLQRVAPIDRHDFLTDLVRGAMKANGETELDGFFGQLANLGNESGGGDGDSPGTKVEAPFGIQSVDCTQDSIVVGEGFAHPHKDNIIKGRSGFGSGPVPLDFPLADFEKLGNDLTSGEMPFPAGESGGAELTTVGATDLARYTDRTAGFVLSDTGLWVANEDRFDQAAIFQLKEEFLRISVGVLDEQALGWTELITLR